MTEPMTLLSEDELAALKALRELAETLPPYDWQWTTLTGENGPYQSHEDMIEGIAKTIRHSESLGLHAITWNDEDADGRSSVVCTTGNGPTSPLHAQYIAAVKPSNILRLLAHIAALTEERDGLKEERDTAIRRRDRTIQWYAERLEPIKDVAKRVGVWPEVAAIIANGSGTRQLEDGSYKYEPPTYAQQLNMAIHKAATARTSALKEAAEYVRAQKSKDPEDIDVCPQQTCERYALGILALAMDPK